jgi:hypothetical protein
MLPIDLLVLYIQKQFSIVKDDLVAEKFNLQNIFPQNIEEFS